MPQRQTTGDYLDSATNNGWDVQDQVSEGDTGGDAGASLAADAGCCPLGARGPDPRTHPELRHARTDAESAAARVAAVAGRQPETPHSDRHCGARSHAGTCGASCGDLLVGPATAATTAAFVYRSRPWSQNAFEQVRENCHTGREKLRRFKRQHQPSVPCFRPTCLGPIGPTGHVNSLSKRKGKERQVPITNCTIAALQGCESKHGECTQKQLRVPYQTHSTRVQR